MYAVLGLIVHIDIRSRTASHVRPEMSCINCHKFVGGWPRSTEKMRVFHQGMFTVD